VPYCSAVIYVEPGGCEICGNVEGRESSTRRNGTTKSGHASSGTDAAGGRESRMLLSLNQCNHTYSVVFENGPARVARAGGM